MKVEMCARFFVSILIFRCHSAVINTEETSINLIEKSNQVDDIFDESLSEQLTKRQIALKELLLRMPELNVVFSWFKFVPYQVEGRSRAISTNDTRCEADLRNLASVLTEKWTLPLIDSYGKPPSGILRGNLFWSGNYDECRSFKAPKSNLFPFGFEGRYCLLKLKVAVPSLPGLSIGICVPNSCASENLMNEYPNLLKYLSKFPTVQNYVKNITNLSVNCLPESSTLSASSISFVILVSVILALVTAGTGYDLYDGYYKSNARTLAHEELTNELAASVNNAEPNNEDVQTVKGESSWDRKFLFCFSALKNGKAILDTSVKPGQMNCLHGIRFISITWVILGHVYALGFANFGNLVDVVEQFGQWTFRGVSSATYSVDTFFLLSGFLLTYLFMKDSRPFTLKKLGVFYAHRYVRLTPVYIFVVFGFGTLYNFTGDGPYWPYQDRDGNVCTKYFWRNLLYINNFEPYKSCIGWTWYLANDMQFFVISPLFLVFLKCPARKWRYIGLFIVLGMMIISWITTIIIVVKKKYEMPIYLRGKINISNTDPASLTGNEASQILYVKPWCRIGPYLIGCLLGYVMVQLKGKQNFISTTWNVVLWSFAVILALVDVYWVQNPHSSLATSAIYYAFARSAWAVAVAWVVFACLTGHGGVIDKLLSWNVWFPLSRLTYCAYLTHPVLMSYYFQNMRSPVMINNTYVAIHYLGFTVLMYGVAFVTSIALESPVIRLEKLLRERLSRH